MPRIICWFSCGAASAIATKLALAEHKAQRRNEEFVVAYCETGAEHEDNERFLLECEAWFGQPIVRLKNQEYQDTWALWESRRYLAGIDGAPCTVELKVVPRLEFQLPDDIHVFGYTADRNDAERARLLKANYPELTIWVPLIDKGITKQLTLAMIMSSGIALPILYALGFHNNNCFQGETEFLTQAGTVTLRDSVGSDVRVLGFDGDWTDARIESFGVQPLVEIVLSRASETRSLMTTAGHRWLVGSNARESRETTTDQLVVGDPIVGMPLPGESNPGPWSVVSVTRTALSDEVFCAVVPNGNAFTLAGGILTGNCIPCVKATSPSYWALVRKHFPAQFERMATLSRMLDVRLCRINGERAFIDEIPLDHPTTNPIAPSCDFLCHIAEQDLQPA